MTQLSSPPVTRIEARKAVEALRSGVPSAAAVRCLGSGQDTLQSRILNLLRNSQENSDRQPTGLVLRANFGEGKSHLLTCFEYLALDNRYAVSRVVISKETPLQTPAKVLAAAVENLRVPGGIGRGLDEIGVALNQRVQSAEFQQLEATLAQEGGLNSRFAATLHLFRLGASDEELRDRVLRFWSGDKFTVSDAKRYLRGLGENSNAFRFEPIRARELALETFTFLPLLFRAAGLRGWVLLFDEVELIGRYTRLGRGRSYGELARWMGCIPGEQRPGLVTVAAVTSDYTREVLIGKQDLDQMGLYLSGRGPEEAPPAERGMRLLEQAEPLQIPNESVLQQTYDTLRALHRDAYAWDPPDVAWPEALGATPMRTYVRAWINAWDVRRLYPESRADAHGYEVDAVRTDYGEEAALEADGPEEASD